MREILFRGKRFDNKEFEYGYLLEMEGRSYILNGKDGNPTWSCKEVDPKTVGQYTGLTDKNDEKIFEGDELHILEKGDYGGEYYAKVEYFSNWGFYGYACLRVKEIEKSKTNDRVDTLFTRGFLTRKFGACELIGNAINYEKCEITGNKHETA